MLSREKIYVKNHYRYDAIFIFSILAMSVGFLFDSPKEILDGYINILKSPSHLLTDYMAVGGIGATFLNAGFLTPTFFVLYPLFFSAETFPVALTKRRRFC